MTDFSPLLAKPQTFLLGAAAQFGIFGTLLAAQALGFTFPEAASIAIIGGADGPTAIFLTSRLADHPARRGGGGRLLLHGAGADHPGRRSSAC